MDDLISRQAAIDGGNDGIIQLQQGDCLELMKNIPDGSVDMILCDLPHGTTQNQWDSVIPLDALWYEYKRLIKRGGIIALFAQTPFDKVLSMSNIEWLKYEYIWEKNRATGHLNSKKAPLKAHENILIFYQTYSEAYDTTDMFDGLKDYMISERDKCGLSSKEIRALLSSYMASHYFTRKTQFSIPTKEAYQRLQSTGYFQRPFDEIETEYKSEREKTINTFNPQGIVKKDVPTIRKGRDNGTNYGKSDKDAIQEFCNYPTDILSFDVEKKAVHPTQKPVQLLEYLIRTYTNDGETVLDNCMGSGSTGVACVNLKRNFIGMELEEKYFKIAEERINNARFNQQTGGD